MTSEKIHFNLSGVPQTLLFPLFGRALLSQEVDSFFHDPHAVKLLDALKHDFAHVLKDDEFISSMSWAGERANYFDDEIKRFIKAHPRATIVNIGAGLETAFYRVDNGLLTWIDLDVPDVITLRNQLLPPPKRVHYLAKSVFDYSWMDEVAQFSELFLFAGGVFMYFPEQEIKNLFLAMGKKLPNAHLVFDVIYRTELLRANEMLAKLKPTDAKFQWGFDEEEIKSWSPEINFLSARPYTNPKLQTHFVGSMVTVKLG